MLSKGSPYNSSTEIRVDPSDSKEEVIQNDQPKEQEMDEKRRNDWFRSIMEVKVVKNKQPLGPKIPRVGDLSVYKDEECYNPVAVSTGPYHYSGRRHELSEVEILKVPMARQFIIDSKKDVALLYNDEVVQKAIQEARGFYYESSTEGFDDEQFAHMMFLDGCFVLQFINCVMSNYKNLEMSDQQVSNVKRDLLLLENQLPFPVLQSLMSLRYEVEEEEEKCLPNIFQKDNKNNKGMKLIHDFLSTQILQPRHQRPLWARRLLWPGLWVLLFFLPIALLIVLVSASSANSTPYGYRYSSSAKYFGGVLLLIAGISSLLILVWILRLLWFLLLLPFTKKTPISSGFDQQPDHLLECLYFIFLGKGEQSQEERRCGGVLSYLATFSCLKKFIPAPKSKSPPVAAAGSRGHYLYDSANDLKKVGIHFMPSQTSALKAIKFKSSFFYGTLKLPSITIDNSTKTILFNLVAYETSATRDDDQLWVTSYICFMDSLINDAEDVKELRSKGILINYLGFDQLVADLFNQMGSSLDLDTNAYNDVKKAINKQYESTLKKWVAEWQQTYFRSPWAFIAFAAAAAGLALTAVQTYYEIHPPGAEAEAPKAQLPPY